MTTGSPPATSANSYARTTGINIQSGERPQHAMNDDDSGDEWGIEIPVGDLIIDLDADLQKDEQRKNDARNTNNNNSIKGSGSMSNSEVSNTSQPEETNGSAAVAAKIFKPPSGTSAHTSSGAGSVVNKSKSKAKKTSKSTAGAKHTSSSLGTIGKTDSHAMSESAAGHIRNGAKSETAVAAKSGRSQKKHNKAMNNCDKRGDNGSIGSKEVREKQSKAGKGNNKHASPFNTSTALSSVKPPFPSTPDIMSPLAPGHSAKSSRGMPVNSSLMQNSRETVPTGGEDRPHMDAINNVSSIESAESLPGSGNFRNEMPIVKSASSYGKHKKSMSIPPAAKYNNSTRIHCSKAGDMTAASGRNADHRTAIGKRDRSSVNGGLQNSSKKIKMEKINKGYVSGMTPVDGGSLVKANTGAPVNISGNPPEQPPAKTDSKMTVGQQKSSNEARTDRRSSSRNSSKIAKSSNTANAAVSTGQECPALPQRESDAPDERVRSVGTLTTHSDIGISAEPESLGPCEPGTNVNLSGIVWHETESGVLVVNVTWRNRSYVGTLLDATKHDWAPPRIPDVDSDVEFRLKSGRPKRLRAGNGNALTDGRKSRKSAAAAANNNNNDEYKCSPSSSNKRRSNKISESDVCSGNDGDICATPSKSAKRARMARTAAGKQSAQRTVNTATAVKESSGDGTSGSGSSTCSSPVFVECSFANCKKRYSDETALKYHEVYAHKDEEMEKASDKAANDVDSLADTDSPKGSENASSKSNDETLASDSNCISNEPESGTSASPATLKPMEVEPSSTPQVSPATQTPFVVTQPSVTMTTTSKIMEKYPSTSFCHSNDNNPSVSDESVFTKASGEEKRTSRLSTKNFETGRQASQAVERSDRALSPYTLTDSLTNESISLKTHTSNKASTLSYHQRPTTAYGDVQGLPGSQSTSMEHSNAVDNESAQAVQTLLQLQENTHDQLPGLTPYSQHSRSTTIQAPKDVPPSTSSASFAEIPGGKFPRGPSPESINKPQHHGIVNPPFRGHSKDGAPLPRMTVRVSSPRNQYANGQFVNVNYPHGAVTANSPQERAVHHLPSSGLKTVKGKTVPIPTDPQQNLSSLQLQSPAAVLSSHSLPSTKKQKRKKQRPEFSSKSPSEATPRIGSTELQEQSRVKQEHPQSMANVLPLQTTGRGQHEVNNRAHTAASHSCLRDGDIKTEPGSSSLNLPSGSKPPNSPQVSTNQTPRAKPYVQSELDPRDQAQQILAPGNKPSANKPPQLRVPTEQTTQNRSSQHPSHSGFVEDRSDMRGKSQHALLSTRNDSAHSLPGSRSLTPVNTGNQATSKTNRQNRNQGPSVHSTPAPLAKEAVVSHVSAGHRQLSAEGVHEAKRSTSSQHPVFGQFPMPYVGDMYQAEFMHHPQLTSFFEQVITQEYQKDQKPKEPQRDVLSQNRIGRSTPSPAETVKQNRTISPPKEVRRNLESPSRGQPHFSSPYPSQIQAPPQRVMHNMQRGSTPRASPVPSESAPNRMHSGVSNAPRGPSPRVTPPPSHAGKRPPRPNSGTEKFHRREGSIGERPPATSRTPTATPVRKQQMKEGYPDQRIQSPEKKSGGPHPQTLFSSPNVPMQIAGNRPQVQFYPGYSPLIDPRSIASYFPAAAYMFPGGPHLFQAPWPHGAPPPGVAGAGPPEKPQTPHSVKPSRDRPSSGSRSPFRDETERMAREGPRARDVDSYAGSGERRMADAPTQVRKSVTPDPKAQSVRGPQGESEVNPPMQRHLHTHHHIHEGFHVLPPHAAQYGYPIAATSAVIAGTEAAAALTPYPKREVP